MSSPSLNAVEELESRWRQRQEGWARRLGRLRLGAEPIEEQLARYRRVTWGLLVVPGVMSLIFLSLFSVFGRPGIGLVVAGLLFVPIASFSWLGYWNLARKAAAYRAEEAAFEAERQRLLAGADRPSPLTPSGTP